MSIWPTYENPRSGTFQRARGLGESPPCRRRRHRPGDQRRRIWRGARGDDFLVIGHESFGQVEAVGPNVTELCPDDYVVATVRRPGASIYDQIGTYDMTTDDTYYERGINLRHGYLTEYYVDDAGVHRQGAAGPERGRRCCWSR